MLLGGAHGFDGADDLDGRFLAEVLGRFEARVGAENVAKVALTEDASAPLLHQKHVGTCLSMLGSRPCQAATTFPLSKVVSFISVEHCRGSLFASELKRVHASDAPNQTPKTRACGRARRSQPVQQEVGRVTAFLFTRNLEAEGFRSGKVGGCSSAEATWVQRDRTEGGEEKPGRNSPCGLASACQFRDIYRHLRLQD